MTGGFLPSSMNTMAAGSIETAQSNPFAATWTQEVRYLHFQLFGREASQGLIEAYVGVHHDRPELMEASAAEISTVGVVIKRRLDALGIEAYLRSRGRRRHLLTRKIMLINYLAECDGCHPEFSRRSPGRLQGFLVLASVGLIGMVRLLRGRTEGLLHGCL